MSSHVAGTTPYPWPWNGDLSGPRTALTVVVPAHAEPELDETQLAAVHRIVAAIRTHGGLVITVVTRPPGRPGVQPHKPRGLDLDLGLDPDLIDHHVVADGIDGFSGSPLEGLLRTLGIERVILLGAGLETCVHSTMRSANDRGFECLLVIDATAAYDRSLVGAAVSMIEMSGGIFGAVGTATNVISAYTSAQGA